MTSIVSLGTCKLEKGWFGRRHLFLGGGIVPMRKHVGVQLFDRLTYGGPPFNVSMIDKEYHWYGLDWFDGFGVVMTVVVVVVTAVVAGVVVETVIILG